MGLLTCAGKQVCEALDRQMVKVESNLEPTAQKRPICTFSNFDNLAD